MNWVVRLGKDRGLRVYKQLFAAASVSLLALSVFARNPFWLLAFLAVPLAAEAVKVAAAFYNDIPRCIKANANTIITYQVAGLAMVLAALLT